MMDWGLIGQTGLVPGSAAKSHFADLAGRHGYGDEVQVPQLATRSVEHPLFPRHCGKGAPLHQPLKPST